MASECPWLRNGGPTRPEHCFLSRFMQSRREVAHLVLSQAQKQPCCLHPLGAPTHFPPFLLKQNLSPKGHCWKWHHKYQNRQLQLVVKGLKDVICSTTWYQLKEDMVIPLITSLHNLSCSFKCYCVYVSNNLWCHFQQCPWEIGSVWAERVGQGDVGWC